MSRRPCEIAIQLLELRAFLHEEQMQAAEVVDEMSILAQVGLARAEEQIGRGAVEHLVGVASRLAWLDAVIAQQKRLLSEQTGGAATNTD